MNPVDWFEIPVTDMARAKRFYEDVFGLQISLDKMGQRKWDLSQWTIMLMGLREVS